MHGRLNKSRSRASPSVQENLENVLPSRVPMSWEKWWWPSFDAQSSELEVPSPQPGPANMGRFAERT